MPMTALIPMLAAGAAMIAPAVLQSQVEAFSGQAAVVDPRLLLPACARPGFGWAPGGRSVLVNCAVPAWRVFVPVGEAAPLPPMTQRPEAGAPAVRRGDRVTVEVGGAGFVIGMEAVAEGDARDGRVALRGANGGRRLTGIIGADGHVRLREQRPVEPRDSINMVNGR